LLPLLSACQRKEENKEKKKLQIGVTIYDSYDTFLSGYMTAFEKEISKKRAEGVEIGLFRYNAAGSQPLQNEQVEEMLEKDCDVLCVNLVDRTAPSEIIDMAKKKNVPIIFFNRELVDEDLAQWNQLYYVGADAKQSGVLQGEMAAEDILSEEPEKIISGGPMMGMPLFKLDIPVTKNSSSILAFKKDQVAEEATTPCINCGRCVTACPENLMPTLMMVASLQKNTERFEKLYGMECIECGCCSYVCPARRPLTQGFKQMKRKVNAEKRAKAAKA